MQFCPDLSQVFSPSLFFCYIAYAMSTRRYFSKIYMQVLFFVLNSIILWIFERYQKNILFFPPNLILISSNSYRIKIYFLTSFKNPSYHIHEKKKFFFFFVYRYQEKNWIKRNTTENHIRIPKGPRMRDTCDFELEKVNTRSARWRGMSLLHRWAVLRAQVLTYIYFSCNIVVTICMTI